MKRRFHFLFVNREITYVSTEGEAAIKQPEEEAKDIALSLELFVNGSMNIFNHQTNVDMDNRFTVYGIRDLGTELSPITMLVVMEAIQQRIIDNGRRGKHWGSDAQLKFVTNSQSGMGLLECGSTVIPFDNQISKETGLYKLYNTNIHEIIAKNSQSNKEMVV